jgi:DNA-binding NtrC family response regulator
MSKARILLVDDEERILRSLGMLLRAQYEVFATSDGNEALAILRREKIHVIVSDQRMPIMTGTELLRQARQIAPDAIRILLTGYADAEAAVEAVNEGEIFRYINKPWGPKELRDTIAQATEIALNLENAPLPGEIAAVADQGLICLVLDQDEDTYKAVRDILEPQQHTVLWRRTFSEAMEELAKTRVSILVTELSLGNVDLSAMVKTLKQEHPDMLTIILTCFKDTSRLVDLINQAQVFRYLPKPVRKGLLGRSIEASIARYYSLHARPVALKAQVVEMPRNLEQQNESAKVADYLARLRARVAASPGGRLA